jgi:DNA-binding transcriptional ArsR family regulator
MELYQYLLDEYGYDEPILTEQLKEKLKLNPSTLRQYIKRLSDKGLLAKVQNGIYFIPKKKPMFGSAVLDTDQIVRKKFLEDRDCIIGYKSGTNFANALGLTSQTAAVATIVTNHASAAKREVNIYKKRFIIRKPRVNVNKSNYKLLQVLDLLNNYEQYSEKPIEMVKEKILSYLEGLSLNEREVKEYLDVYPIKTKLRVYELGLLDAIARRERVV